MPKFEVDSARNVIVRSETSVIVITAYNPSLKAVKAGFSYLPVQQMAHSFLVIFENEKKILEYLKKAGKLKDLNEEYKIDNVCLYYCSTKLVISRNDSKIEVRNKLLRASQD